MPTFTWESLPNSAIKIIWLPNIDGNPGSDFSVKYRIKGNSEWINSRRIYEDDFIVIKNLEPSETYEFKVTSISDEYTADSDIQEISTIKYGKLGKFFGLSFQLFGGFYS